MSDNDFVRYLNYHLEELDDILHILIKLKDLGINFCTIVNDADFSNEEYTLNKKNVCNQEIIFVQNVIINAVNDEVIKYKTNESNFKIIITKENIKKIIIKNFLFEEEELPQSLSIDFITNYIFGLTQKNHNLLEKKYQNILQYLHNYYVSFNDNVNETDISEKKRTKMFYKKKGC